MYYSNFHFTWENWDANEIGDLFKVTCLASREMRMILSIQDDFQMARQKKAEAKKGNVKWMQGGGKYGCLIKNTIFQVHSTKVNHMIRTWICMLDLGLASISPKGPQTGYCYIQFKGHYSNTFWRNHNVLWEESYNLTHYRQLMSQK